LPASAEAPRLIGAALALDRLARRDQALLTGVADWERPLELARARAPSSAASERVLAAAYLEIWPGLDGDRRERATRVLRTAFEEPGFRQRAFDRWLALAGSIDAATALLPDLPDVWARLLRAAADGGDLERAAQLAVREQDALERSLGEQLERAEQLAGKPGGDLAARGEIDRLLELAPPDLRFAPLVGRALASRPAGPAGPSLARAARRWLVWARPLVLLGFEPLPPAALGRLAGAVGAGLPAEEAAWAALASGDRPRAELLARRSDALWSEAWAPYLVLDARARLAAGERSEARALLEQVHRNARRWPSWRQLARAAGLAPPPPAAREPAGWQPTHWQVEARVPRLAFELAAPARGLRLGLATPLAQPTLLVAELDGRSRRPIALEAGATEIRLPFPLEPGAHLLRISVRTGSAPALGVTTPE
ncbi:MAG TPA: hypothetical protein VLA66_13805, partial [Thermoanaerobaculia bacterium]|nr:hypothetical protein [Thermoanaerobaculia bacterium]